MIRSLVRAAALLLLSGSGALTWAQSKYVLETKPGVDAAPIASRYALTLGRSWTGEKHISWSVTSHCPLSTTMVRAIEAEPGVLELEPDVEHSASEANASSTAKAALESLTDQLELKLSVPFFGSMVREAYVNQPATRMVGLASALQQFGTGASAVVAIIDTGVDPRHPALRNVLLPGYDFTRELPQADEWADLDPATAAALDQSTVAILDQKNTPVRLNQSTVAILDQSTVAILDGTRLPAAFGHGTMVAGLVHLMAPQARILPLKAFRGDGSAELSSLSRAIYYAVDNGATIISMSFSSSAASVELSQAVAYAASKGVILVASAGNESAERRVYPAALPKVLGVGSVNYSDRRSPFSNYGESVRTAAPGEAVITTYPGNNYAAVWGTSFSTAEVAGAVALMQQLRPRAAFDKVKDALDHGYKVSADMGDARLLLPRTLQYCLTNY